MAGAASAELIHDGPHLQALVRRGTSPFVLVTFNSRGFRANGRTIWGEPLAEKLGLNAVGFVTKRPNWFPGEDFAAAMAAVQPYLAPFAERIGYGYSQGAYAAIRASRPLALTATIAVSPQWSIDSADIVDTRYNRFFDAAANAGMALTGHDAPQQLFILADTGFVEDKGHLAQITAAIPSARIVAMPASDHDTITVLRGSAPFAALLEVVRGDGDIAGTVARIRRASPVRREVLIRRALLKGQGARAYRLFAGGTFDDKTRAVMMSRFARRGEAARVIKDARQHASEHRDDAHAKAVLAYVLAGAGRMARARELAERAEAMSKRRKVLRLTRAVRRGQIVGAPDEDDDDE